MTENKTQAGKDGLRFDWYPILQADFLDELAVGSNGISIPKAS
jgi:hypothetical protein